MFREHLLNFLLAWFRSRKWLRIGGLGLLLGCVPLASMILVISGASTPISVMAANYHELIEETGFELDASTASTQDTKLSNRQLQVPLRRILQMDAANDRVKYFVAYELSQQGRLSMAARLMRDVAPAKESGYPDAHAWLAAYAIGRRSAGAEVDLQALMHDLKIAINQASAASPSMIVYYAGLLSKQQKGDEALTLLRTRRQQFPGLNVTYAELAKELDKPAEFKAAIRDGTRELEARLESGEGGESDIIQLVNLVLLDEKS